jgi:hypothetical protein
MDYQAGEMTEPTLCETRWKAIVASFEKNHEELTTNNPDCQEEIELLGNGLSTIGQLIHTKPTPNSRDSRIKSQGQVQTKNFFAPLRTSGMDVEETANKPEEQQPSNKSGRPPPIVLTSMTNVMQLQRKVKDIVTGNFEFRGPELSRRKWRTSQPSKIPRE